MNRRERRAAQSRSRERPKSEKEGHNGAVLEIRPGRYFAVIAFCYGNEHRDWLGTIYRDADDGPWQLRYRFRYYAPGNEDAWNQLDTKRFFASEAPASRPEAEVIEAFCTIAQKLHESGFNDRIDLLKVQSSDQDYLFHVLSERPWFHMKVKDMPS